MVGTPAGSEYPVKQWRTFRLGRKTFAVSGDGAFAAAVAAALAPVASDESYRPEVVFCFFDSLPHGSSLLGKEEVAGREIRTIFSWSEEDCPTVYVAAMLPARFRAMPRSVFRAIHPAFVSQFEHLATGFMYQVFNGLVQSLNVSANQSFIHAAAVEKGAVRVAIIGRGGMGKTGSLLRLVRQEGWRYLSDDWTVLDDSGVLERSHKPVQVHARNLAGLSGGKNFLLQQRSSLDRLAWNVHLRLLKRRGVKRRSHAVALFGSGGVGAPGPLSSAYLVKRGDVDAVRDEMADVGEFVSRTAEMTARELAPSYNLLGPVLTVGAPEPFRLDSSAVSIEPILRRAFSKVTLRVLTVPRSMPEPQIEDHIVRTVAKTG